MPLSLQQLAERIGARLVPAHDGARQVHGCAAIDQAGPDQVTFLANPRYSDHLESTKAAAVVVGDDVTCPPNLTLLVAGDPYFAFRNAIIELHGFRQHPQPIEADQASRHQGIKASRGVGSGALQNPKSKIQNPSISRLAAIHPTAVIGAGATIHPHVVIEAGARIGADCVLYPGVYIGAEAVLGDACVLYPNVVVYERCVLGNRVALHANTVIGQDGFGYATHKGAHHKIPQTGIVVIEDDVELGAGCAVERAAMGETRIGKGTKFADLISIGHGTTIGKHCLFVSLVGVAGSVEVGDYVALGGQVGVSGHLRIGHRVQAAGQAAIVQDIPDGMKVGGTPAIELDKAKRNALAGLELYELAKRVRKLERELGLEASKRQKVE